MATTSIREGETYIRNVIPGLRRAAQKIAAEHLGIPGGAHFGLRCSAFADLTINVRLSDDGPKAANATICTSRMRHRSNNVTRQVITLTADRDLEPGDILVARPCQRCHHGHSKAHPSIWDTLHDQLGHHEDLPTLLNANSAMGYALLSQQAHKALV
jgi:hypothetical protein